MVYESRLELARLLLADFDPDVVGIAAQPFLVREADRRHVPDFLLSRADGSVLIVNVKPAERLEDERSRRRWRGLARVFAERGWEHEVWSGADAQLLANVRFLAGYRRAALLGPLAGVEDTLRDGRGADDRRGGGGAERRGRGRAAAGGACSVVVGAVAGRLGAAVDWRDRTGGAVVSVACLAVGSRVAYDGGVWTVVALDGDRVTVQEQGSGRSRVGADRGRCCRRRAADCSIRPRCAGRGASARRWPA